MITQTVEVRSNTTITTGQIMLSEQNPVGCVSLLYEVDWYEPNVDRNVTADSVSQSLGAYFDSLLPEDPRILGVYWMCEREELRIWTVIDNIDFELESSIYEAQCLFLDRMPEIDTDFSIIYLQGRSLAGLLPTDAVMANRFES